MKVVHLTPALFGHQGVFGGAERYSLELARAMAEVTPTTLVAFSDEPSSEFQDGALRIVTLGPARRVRGQRFNRVHQGLWRVLADADVVHCHQPHTLSSELAALAAWWRRQRVFATDLGGGGWCLAGYWNTDRWFDGHLHISHYSRVVAGHSESDRAHVIHGGIDLDKFSPSPVPRRKPVVSYVGRIMPHKGIHDLVSALPDGLRLRIIGRPYHERYFADLREQSRGKDVEFVTDASDDDVVEAYRSSLCIVLPSVYKSPYGEESRIPELLGQTVLEGMACGTPAIVTDVASLPEVVVDQETGFIVPAHAPEVLRARLSHLRDAPELVERLGAAGRQRVATDFTWPVVVERCLNLYCAGSRLAATRQTTSAVGGA